MRNLDYLSKLITIHLYAGLFVESAGTPDITNPCHFVAAGRVSGYRHALDIIGDYPSYDNIYFVTTSDRFQKVIKEEFPYSCQSESDAKYICTISPKDNSDGFEVTIEKREE